jgi:hypothetical protein
VKPAPDDCRIYSPEATDDWPPWKLYAFNAIGTTLALVLFGLVVAALWALWMHLWLVPIIAVPILMWALLDWIKHPR